MSARDAALMRGSIGLREEAGAAVRAGRRTDAGHSSGRPGRKGGDARAGQRFAGQRGLRLGAHIAESCSVPEAVQRRYARPGVIGWLEELGALGPNWLAAPSVHLSAEEIGIMARRDVCVAHNPVSNMFLGDGFAPVVEMLKAGVTVALGTDGSASNNSQDMFEVVKTAAPL